MKTKEEMGGYLYTDGYLVPTCSPWYQEMEVGMLTTDAAARFVPVSSAFFVLDWPPVPAEFSTARRRSGLVMVG